MMESRSQPSLSGASRALLSPVEARDRIERGEAVLIDVREPLEHAREHIEAARLLPLKTLRAEAVPDAEGRLIILHCQSGKRSAEGARALLERSGVHAAQVEGGIDAWKRAGLPTVINRAAPIPVMRQVQIVAGSLVLLGTVLGVVVSPWFLVVPGFVGGGLAVSGASGWCGMAKLLEKMPWNRVPAPPRSSM